MTRTPLSPTSRSTIKRGKNRAETDRTALYQLLDTAMVCHLGVVVDGAPVVLPTCYGRAENTLLLHGSSGARSLLTAATGVDVCVTVTLLDGVVYARSVFDFSVNYRSAIIHGKAVPLSDEADKLHGLQVLTEHIAPGSWDYARKPNRKELAATTVLALSLTEAAVKIRTGPPQDSPEDIAAGTVWAGVLPLDQRWKSPEPCPQLPSTVELPEHIRRRMHEH